MFQISSYLQFRNTPDGKPRVLKANKDFEFVSYDTTDFYYEFRAGRGKERKTYHIGDLKDKSEIGYLINIDGDYDQTRSMVAKLEDCRPLLTGEIDGVEWTEGDILEDNNGQWHFVFFSNKAARFEINSITKIISKYDLFCFYDWTAGSRKLKINIFDNPKISLKRIFNEIWDCSQEEGWEKIFKLLEIEK